jgi:hypothetical protein
MNCRCFFERMLDELWHVSLKVRELLAAVLGRLVSERHEDGNVLEWLCL